MHPRSCLLVCSAFAATSLLTSAALATPPPPPGGQWPNFELAQRIQSYVTAQQYTTLMRTIQANRAALAAGQISSIQADERGGTTIRGQKAIPVLMIKFSDTRADPYPVANMQQQLFNGPWPTGTMTDFYREISYGQFTVTGTVYPWQQATQTGDYYAGPVTGTTPCNALCPTNRLGEMLKEALALANRSIDFSQYDNDGPDGVPNSGDDDGVVDFVAFVHPVMGGECPALPGQINNNIWSHRFSLTALTGSPFETSNVGRNGQRIRINDYVIMPALACDNRSMTPIGVFTHEFGHAFGLPDLYDTGRPAQSEGVGQWDLMGSGSWGGDGRQAWRPAHMAAWSKTFLGWVAPRLIAADMSRVTIRPIERFPDALRIQSSADEYYLVEYRTRSGFDDSLIEPGVLIWKINEPVLRQGLANNRVNADRTNPGVYLEQADGARDLDAARNRGDAGDPYPGRAGNTSLGGASNPPSRGTIAICNIALTPDGAVFDLQVTSAQCAADPGARIFFR